MIGKKKSGFQITSVTSEYDGGDGGGEASKEPPNGEAEFAPLVNGGPGCPPGGHPTPPEPAGADRTIPPPPAGEAASPPAGGGGGGAAVAAPPEASKAPPRTPCPPALAGGGSCSSRFRVVKLDHGLGEPYRRGRWTCVDLYDRDLDGHVLAKVLDGARHVNSLDSHLEVGGFAHKAVGQLRPKLHAPKSQGSPPLPSQADSPRGKAPAAGHPLHPFVQAAKTLSSEGPAGPDRPPGAPAPSSPPRAARGEAGAPKGEGGTPAGAAPKEEAKAGPAPPLGAKAAAGEQAAAKQLPPNVNQPSSGEQGAVRKFSEPRSTSISPAPLTQDSSPSRKTRASEPNVASSLRFTSPMQTLAKSMLSVGTHPDGDDDSGSSSSMVAIDNKIEQAMDLVKSHLMYAVREEVEVLKEQIKELIERNTLLERENALLKSLANSDQLSQLQAQLRTAGTSAGTSGSSPTSTT
ncbi:TSC22 domain family protein 4-like [Carcharodon carcharias]|uniref:TSC22 domain family protein 4-like n=1 Tax=Carcharodon carcharias TaxID=13397 RepID=UPI001B7E21C2|nr:TSC22 domain family protein 4-like [Carcharodon carcharias]